MSSRLIRVFPGFLLVLVLVALGSYFWHSHHNQHAPPSYQKIATNLQFAHASGNKILFFTGSSFASYSLSNNKSTRLSDYVYITGQVTNMSWSDTSATFFVGPTNDSDQLTVAYSRFGVDASIGHWWRYDFATKTLELIHFGGADSCQTLIENGLSLYCLRPHLGSSQVFDLLNYDISNKKLSSILQIGQRPSSLQISGNTIFYITTDLSGGQSLHKGGIGTKNVINIYSSRDRIMSYAVGSGGDILLDQTPTTQSVPMDKRDSNDGSQSSLKQKVVLINSNGKILSKKSINGKLGISLSLPNNNIEFVVPDGWMLVPQKGKLVKDSSGINRDVIVASVNSDTKYFVDNQNNLYSSSNVTMSYKPSDSFTEQLNQDGSGIYVGSIQDGRNAAYIYNWQKGFNDNAQDIDTFLHSLHYDPNQFYFLWQLESNKGTVPVNDNAVVIK
jgi:hypothetical protein